MRLIKSLTVSQLWVFISIFLMMIIFQHHFGKFISSMFHEIYKPIPTMTFKKSSYKVVIRDNDNHNMFSKYCQVKTRIVDKMNLSYPQVAVLFAV